MIIYYKRYKRYFDYGVDESVENICNHNSIIHNLENFISKDGSSWIYINEKKN
ncbi:MAG: hypothetical protein R2837_00790 [Aliarcobacter sp.]